MEEEHKPWDFSQLEKRKETTTAYGIHIPDAPALPDKPGDKPLESAFLRIIGFCILFPVLFALLGYVGKIIEVKSVMHEIYVVLVAILAVIIVKR